MTLDYRQIGDGCDAYVLEGAGGDGNAPERPCVRGIILAGSPSWGGHLLESVVCRPLMPIAGRPLLQYLAEWLRGAGIFEASICGNSHSRQLRRRLGDGRSVNISLEYIEDVAPRGPAGCAHDATEGHFSDLFVVVEACIVPRFDLCALLEAHTRSQSALTIVADSGRNPSDSSEVKGPMGIYVFSRRALDRVPATGYQDIKEKLIPDMYRDGEKITTFGVPSDSVLRVTDAASYLSVNGWAVQRMVKECSLPNGFRRIDDAWVHKSSEVDPTASFVGPALVGPECSVGPRALIIGPTSIGPRCRIEQRAVVSRSALWGSCTVGPYAWLDQCILDENSLAASGVKWAAKVSLVMGRSHSIILDRLGDLARPLNGGSQTGKQQVNFGRSESGEDLLVGVPASRVAMDR